MLLGPDRQGGEDQSSPAAGRPYALAVPRRFDVVVPDMWAQPMWTGAALSVGCCRPAVTANAVTAAPATNTAPAATNAIV